MKFLFFYICGMIKKWYFGTLLTVMALLVIVQQQTVVPNQEIVLEFVDVEITSLEAQNAIAIVKKQLKSIGVQHARISKELKNGKLTISYYSDQDVESIKRILSEEQNVALNHVLYAQNQGDNQFPLNKKSKDYKLDVCEIQKSTDFDTDFNSTYILDVKQKHSRNTGSDLNTAFAIINVDHTDRLVKVAQKVNATIAAVRDNTSYSIPDTRAGPTS